MIDKIELVNLLDKGFTNEQLSKYFNCGITTIKRAKNKFELVGYKTNKKPLTSKQLEEVEILANKHYSLQDVSKLMGISDYLLKKYCDQNIYDRLILSSKDKFVSNLIKADITSIFYPCEKSAYICGVLQSDGFLTSDGYVGLTVKDKDFAEDFAKFFKTKAREIHSNNTVYYGCRFKDIRNLDKFKSITNIVPNKTYSGYTIPEWITSNHSFMLEFIVGVFNGDGCVYKIPNRNTCELSIEQHISNKPMLLFINKYLGWNMYDRENYCRISTKKISLVEEFYNIYSNSENALLRKVSILDQIFYKI